MAVRGLAAAWLLTLLASTSLAQGRSEPSCVNGGKQNPDIVAARTAIQHTPTMLGKRIELAKLLQKAACYDDAVHLLEEGEKYNPLNPTLRFSLRRARSMVREEHYFEGIDQAEATARLSRSKLRCTRLSDVAACDEILSRQPDNTEVIVAKGDALVKENRPEEALAVYTRAARLAPANTSIAGKLRVLQAQRQTMLQRCTGGDGDSALRACKAVLVKGAPNEFEITVHIALLQQSTNQTSQALDSYIAANALRHGDKAVALAILALLDSTQRKDAVALAARGASLITLGRAREAVAPLREAQALEPGLPDIDKQVSAAQALVHSESTVRKETPPRVAANSAVADSAAAEDMVAPQDYSNVAEATRSN
jgi:tetratricopeptide (TPR) repeat protein